VEEEGDKGIETWSLAEVGGVRKRKRKEKGAGGGGETRKRGLGRKEKSPGYYYCKNFISESVNGKKRGKKVPGRVRVEGKNRRPSPHPQQQMHWRGEGESQRVH